MTSDKGVVERLREYLASRPDPSGRTFHAVHPEVLAQEAIARIETLERSSGVFDPAAESFHRRMVAAEAEVVRLTASIDAIHRRLCSAQTEPGYEAMSSYGWCIDECRAALSPQPLALTMPAEDVMTPLTPAR